MLCSPPSGGPSPKQEELAGSGEALDLENSCVGKRLLGGAPHGPLRAPLHQPARRYDCFFLYRLSAQQVPGVLVDALSRILWNARHKRLIKDLIATAVRFERRKKKSKNSRNSNNAQII